MNRRSRIALIAAVSASAGSSASAQPWCPDTNTDGSVSFVDFTTVLLNYCTSGPFADAYRDGIVNLFDIVAVLACFNSPVPFGGCLAGPNPCGAPLVSQFRLGGVGTDTCDPGDVIQTANGGNFFRAAGLTGLGPPTPNQVCANFVRGFHSYVALGDQPVSCGGPAANAVATAGPSSFMGDRLEADWIGGVGSGPLFAESRAAPAPFGSESVFIARLTTPRNDGLRRCTFTAYLQDPLGWHRVSMVLNGPPVMIDDDGMALSYPFGVRTIRSAQPNIAGYGDADVYDLYVTNNAFGGDENGDYCVSFNDMTQVLINWLNNYLPCSGPGDANGDGIVNFADVTYTLVFFRSPYVCL